MPDLDVDAISGNQGQYSPSLFGGKMTVPAGSSGTIIDINVTEGRARLEFLTVTSTQVTNITVIKDGVTLISGQSIGFAASGNFFVVAQKLYVNLNAQQTTGVLSDIIGKSIQVIVDTGTTEADIYYSFTEGK